MSKFETMYKTMLIITGLFAFVFASQISHSGNRSASYSDITMQDITKNDFAISPVNVLYGTRENGVLEIFTKDGVPVTEEAMLRGYKTLNDDLVYPRAMDFVKVSVKIGDSHQNYYVISCSTYAYATEYTGCRHKEKVKFRIFSGPSFHVFLVKEDDFVSFAQSTVDAMKQHQKMKHHRKFLSRNIDTIYVTPRFQ